MFTWTNKLLKILFFSFVLFFAGLNSTLKAQEDSTVIEEAVPDTYPSPQVDHTTQTESNVNPHVSFIAPNYTTIQDAYTTGQVPNPKSGNANGYISDPNDYLSASDEQKINAILYEIEQTSTAQVAVVFLKSIGDRVPKKFATDLFEQWGIGQAHKDNGLLILNVIDQRRTEIEVGYGLEGILPDITTFKILQNEVVPHFKKGNYGAGMIAATNRIQTILKDPSVVDEIYDNGTGSTYQKNTQHGLLNYLFWAYLVISMFFIIAYWILILVIDRSKEDYYDKYKRLEPYYKAGCLNILFFIPYFIIYRVIKKRLKKYRNAPRFSRKNGKKMTLLNAWTENKYLEKEQILEEKIDSKEYDVWATEAQDDIMILTYKGENSRKYSKCKECGYKTFGRTNSTVIRSATYNHSGKRKVYYKCKNCHYEETKEEVIPQKTRSSSSSSGSSFSSSSGGSSSFGGGSSGGGGAGVSW